MRGMLEQHCCNQKYCFHFSNTEAFYKMEEAASKIKNIVTKYQDNISDNMFTYFKQSFKLKHQSPQLYGAPKLRKIKIKWVL